MNDLHTAGPAGSDDGFHMLMRRRLHQLADHAPTAVRTPDEIIVRAEPPRHRRRAAGIGATVAALIGAAGLTTVALNGAGSGGAATPGEAVLLFVDALEREDLLGMIDVVDPAEVPAVRAAAEQGASEATRVGLLDDGFALDGVAGVGVEVADLQLDTQQLADDLAVVSATAGSIGVTFDPAAFGFGDALRPVMGDGDTTLQTTDLVDAGLQLATVRRDGRWYVSISYTIAELARRSGDAEFPVAEWAAGDGFDSPEAATTALYQRLAAFDIAGAVATAAPGEGDALARYASLWLPSVQQAADRAIADGYGLTVSDLVFDTTGSADRRTVAAREFTISGTLPPSSAGEALDPSLPTVIFLEAGAGYVLVPAGEPLPAEVDPAVVTTDQVPDAFNTTSAGPDGVVRQVPFTDPATEGQPVPLTIVRADGCTTWSGAGASGQLNVGTLGFEQVGDDSWRTCDEGEALGAIFFLAAGGFVELPDVATVQVDGRWYVSPLGTAAASVLDVLQSVPDGATLFDSRLGNWVYGTNRALAEQIYVGRPLDSIDAACIDMMVADESGIIVGVVADPPVELIRACGYGFSMASSSGPQPVVATEQSVAGG